MNIIRSKEFEGTRAWDALHILTLSGISVRLHWADQPYIWHVNDGQEVFGVMDGMVDMHYRIDAVENVVALEAVTCFMREWVASMWRIHGLHRGFCWWRRKAAYEVDCCIV